MNKTIVDSNYPGLKEESQFFRLEGGISVEGSLEIKLNKLFVVNKGIEAGSR